MSFTTELQSCINRHSKENGSNTPDFILAEYLAHCLASFDEIMRRRDKWYAKENKTTDSFQWTDELVTVFALEVKVKGYSEWVIPQMEKFKQSHSPKPQAENKPIIPPFKFEQPPQRIEVIGVEIKPSTNKPYYNLIADFLLHGNKLSITLKKAREAIEQVLNDEPQAFRPVWKVDRSPIDEELKWPKPTEEAKEMYRDYANKQKLFTTEDGVDVYEWFDDVFIVYADFSCDFNCFAGEVSPSVKAKDSRHKIFHSIEAAKKYIAENKPQPQKAERHWMGSPSPFDKAIWSSGRTEKDALFVTEDRIVINTGDTFWAVGIEFKKHRFDGASNDHHPVNWPMYHYFGKEDAADRYIKENKPLDISMKEIASCVTVVIKQGIRLPHNEAAFIDFKKLEEIIKSKQ